ncbi:MAG: CPBP family intramembrane metalloprotease [Chitinophagaceae bacterium]|nr:CPBP family intramembrane metalloprotease [Chitinophagaceae bacterium]
MDIIDQNSRGISYKAGFFMLVVFAVGGMFLASLISMAIIMLMTGQSFSAADLLTNPQHYRLMQVVQSVSAIVIMFLPTLFTAGRLNKRPIELTGFKGSITLRQLGLVILITACGLALSSALGYMSYQIPFPKDWKIYFDKWENDYMKQAASLIKLDNGLELFISIIVLALVPAICEETFFRGGLQNYLYRSNGKKWMSVILVSLIFSIIHFSAYGFLSRFILGMVLGLVFHYTRRLWLSILVHFINNAMAVIVLYVQHSKGKPLAELMSDKDGTYWGFIVLPLIFLLFIKLKKESETNFITHGV